MFINFSNHPSIRWSEKQKQAAGVRCVCACSERKVIEEQLDDGTMRKTSVFEFRQFREYDRPNHI